MERHTKPFSPTLEELFFSDNDSDDFDLSPEKEETDVFIPPLILTDTEYTVRLEKFLKSKMHGQKRCSDEMEQMLVGLSLDDNDSIDIEGLEGLRCIPNLVALAEFRQKRMNQARLASSISCGSYDSFSSYPSIPSIGQEKNVTLGHCAAGSSIFSTTFWTKLEKFRDLEGCHVQIQCSQRRLTK